jgi:rRNA maturation protein Nop10
LSAQPRQTLTNHPARFSLHDRTFSTRIAAARTFTA